MKNQILFAVLAVLAIYVSAAVVEPKAAVENVDVVDSLVEVEPAAAANRNLNVGSIGKKDKLLHRSYYTKTPIYNAVQTQDITYRGSSSTKISAIYVNEVGYTQFATARITAGGVKKNMATIRLTSYPSGGYYFQVEIWGR